MGDPDAGIVAVHDMPDLDLVGRIHGLPAGTEDLDLDDRRLAREVDDRIAEGHQLQLILVGGDPLEDGRFGRYREGVDLRRHDVEYRLGEHDVVALALVDHVRHRDLAIQPAERERGDDDREKAREGEVPRQLEGLGMLARGGHLQEILAICAPSGSRKWSRMRRNSSSVARKASTISGSKSLARISMIMRRLSVCGNAFL